MAPSAEAIEVEAVGRRFDLWELPGGGCLASSQVVAAECHQGKIDSNLMQMVLKQALTSADDRLRSTVTQYNARKVKGMARRERLAQRRRAVGFSQESFAEGVGVDRSTVVRWEAGSAEPQPWLRPKIAKALRVELDDLDRLLNGDAAPAPAVVPVRLLGITEPLAASQCSSNGFEVSGHGPVHSELLMHYETLTNTYRHIDYQAGAQSVYAETVTHLNRLLAAADRVPSGLYRRFILGLGDAAQLAAWLAIDSQDYATAQQYGALALSCAQEGEDVSLHSYVLGVMSYIHLHASRGSEALRLLEVALRVADSNQFKVNPAVCSWLYEAMGEAYAFAGDRVAGARSLARSEQLFDAVVPEQVPHWLGFFNAEVHLIRLKGRCLMRLGDCRAAIATAETAQKLLPEHYVRERSGTLVDLAAAHLLKGRPSSSTPEPEAAASIAGQALQLAITTQ